MPVLIGNDLYLTSPEAQLLMGISSGLIAHYFYRNEFRGVIDINDQRPFMAAIKLTGIEIDPVLMEKFQKKSKSQYLVPMASVITKMMRRETRKMTAKENAFSDMLKKQEKEREKEILDERTKDAVLEQIRIRKEMEGDYNGN